MEVSDQSAGDQSCVPDEHPSDTRRAPGRLTPFLIAVLIPACVLVMEKREGIIVAGCAALIALFAAPLASDLFVLFFGAVLGLVGIMSEFPVPGLGFRVYGADVVLYFLAIAGVAWALDMRRPPHERIARTPQERRILVLILAMTVFGLLPFAKGVLVDHHRINDALGDYRRLFFYPLAIVVPLLIPLGARHLRLLGAAVCVAAFLVIATGAYRLMTGQYWHTESYTEFDYDPRLLSSTDTVTLELALAYACTVVATKTAWAKRAAALALALACAAFMVLSGWRLAVVLILVSPTVANVLMARLQGWRVAGAMKLVVGLAITAALTFALLAYTAPREFQRLTSKYQEKLQTFDIGHDQRIWAWKQAIDAWYDNPILGSGLGHELLVYLRTSGGDFIGVVSTAHNVFIIMLYKTGVFGLLIFLLLHGTFIAGFLRRIRFIDPDRRTIAVSLFAGYVSNIITHSLEPFENAGIISLYLMMGIMVLLVRGDARSCSDIGPVEAPREPLSSASEPG